MNSAIRLLEILQKSTEHIRIAPSSSLKLLFESWEQGSSVEKWGEINQLTFIVIENVTSTPHIDHELFSEPLDKLKIALSGLSLSSTVQEFRSKISPLVQGLKFVAHQLEKDEFEDTIEQEALDSITSSTQDLLDKVIDSDVGDELKALLIRSLLQILYSIERYPLYGGFGIRSATSEALGEVLLSGHKRDQSSMEGGMIKKFFEHTKNVNALLSLSRNGTKLLNGAGITNFLGLGG